MATVVRSRDVVAARLRRLGPRAFIGTYRTLFAVVGRAQHSGLCSYDAGTGVPHVAPAGQTTIAQTTHRVHAQESAAAQTRDIDSGRSRRWQLPADHW